jgi:hypothetical protein
MPVIRSSSTVGDLHLQRPVHGYYGGEDPHKERKDNIEDDGPGFNVEDGKIAPIALPNAARPGTWPRSPRRIPSS